MVDDSLSSPKAKDLDTYIRELFNTRFNNFIDMIEEDLENNEDFYNERSKERTYTNLSIIESFASFIGDLNKIQEGMVSTTRIQCIRLN